MTVSGPRRGSLIAESALFAQRLLVIWRREPAMPIQALLYPTFLLVTYHLLVGKSIVRITGTDSLYGLVPTTAVAGAMFGALATGFAIMQERDCGLLSRLWVLPVHRSSALIGRLLAEAARTLVASALITVVGVGLGLRFEGSWLAVVLFILVPVVVALVFSTAVLAIAVRSTSTTAFVWLAVPSITAVFSSSGSPPLETMPNWLQPLIQLQPMWATIESMRQLALGASALRPLLVTSVWAVGLAAIVGPLAVRGYRAAAQTGRITQQI